ncbi:MAG: lipocalin family protein [Bacteroidota bacterium]
MQKIFIKLFLFSIVIFITSCEKNNNENTDLIIGKWEYETHFINGTQITYTDCKPSTIQFSANGKRTDFHYASNSGNCIVASKIDFTWDKLNINSYKSKFIETGNYVFFTTIFENDNNVLTLEYSYYDDDSNFNVEKYVYNRIN